MSILYKGKQYTPSKIMKALDPDREQSSHHRALSDRLFTLDQIRGAWYCGNHGLLPDEFAPYIDQHESDNDPEYIEYLRLKDKFSARA